MEPVTVFICGTLMVPKVGPIVNRILIEACGRTKVKTLAMGGLVACDQAYADLLAWFDAEIPFEQPVVLVGQSQGGLHAVKLALTRPNVHVITVSTPHHATDVALLARILGPLGGGLWDMRRGSAFMRAYEGGLEAIAPRLDSIYLRHDGLVQPYHSCHVTGARNYLFATPDEYRKIGPHAADTVRCDGSANHVSELFSRLVAGSG